MFGLKLHDFFKNNKINVHKFSKQMGVSTQYVYLLFKKESIDTKILEKISNILGLPIEYWFENSNIKESISKNILEEPTNTYNVISDTKEEINLMTKEMDLIKKILNDNR